MKLIDKLKLVRDFQQRFPGSHVGGSIGLFLHGIDLQRSLDKSDVDMTIQTPIDPSQPLGIENTEESSHPEDFDYQFRHYPDGNSAYTKIDINVLPDKQSINIVYKADLYRVSLKEDILYYKKLYAEKGNQKHIDDLITIETGIRPEVKEVVMSETDDLPF